jgi:hypothetical protein
MTWRINEKNQDFIPALTDQEYQSLKQSISTTIAGITSESNSRQCGSGEVEEAA